MLRTFVDVEHAEDSPNREAGALTLLAGTGVPAPGLVAVDAIQGREEREVRVPVPLGGRPQRDAASVTRGCKRASQD
ncbi:hypothetical protein IQ62_34300 [Streptomyces scabiei]|nr:hypothetical protein IQ62_34300 [Streptomyces scabiei]